MKMLSRQKSITTAVLALWVVFSLFYYNILNLVPQYKLSIIDKKEKPIFLKLFKDDFNETGDFLINTPGCSLPNYGRTMIFKPAKIRKSSCGQRGVFIDTLSDDEIVFTINEDILNHFRIDRNPFKCCYEFVSRANSKIPGVNDTKVVFSDCISFENGTTTKLIEEVISVKCVSNNSNKAFYEDAHIMIKKIQKKKTTEHTKKWNVLILGMDTMSRARARYSLPLTIKYFENTSWLDYKGYHKVGYNTYPNLMAMLSGNAKLYCRSSMDHCNDRLLWSKFKNADYATAYAEDNLKLPDTFRNYGGFEVPPTDHYMRPFFLIGEYTKGNKVCTRKMSSAMHVLHYAQQLTKVYENDSFFGLFWINSHSHNMEHNPTLFDKDLSRFLSLLNKNNTFVFFISDHGIRFGETRYSVESFYEERLPMFYMWVPQKFREQYPIEFYNLQVNQNRLVNTYDFHDTLGAILKKSDDTVAVNKSTACPQCTSLFEEKSANRTCTEAGIDEKWCSCRKLVPMSKKTKTAQNIVTTALSAVRNVSSNVKTKSCTRCTRLTLKTILRIHSYFNEETNKTHYIVAFIAKPGEPGYEVVVDRETAGYTVTTPLSTITSYNTKGNCVLNSAHRGYCVCEKIPRCRK